MEQPVPEMWMKHKHFLFFFFRVCTGLSPLWFPVSSSRTAKAPPRHKEIEKGKGRHERLGAEREKGDCLTRFNGARGKAISMVSFIFNCQFSWSFSSSSCCCPRFFPIWTDEIPSTQIPVGPSAHGLLLWWQRELIIETACFSTPSCQHSTQTELPWPKRPLLSEQISGTTTSSFSRIAAASLLPNN